MKYLLLIYNNPAAWATLTEADRQVLMAEVDALMAELAESGELIGGAALADPSDTTTVRVRDGVPALTDGPFAEAKEHLAGYCVLECASRERALAIAAAWPDARLSATQISPIIDTVGALA
ncbi:MAG TPA: YciI family protein [Micromonosporaceae bacterium]